MLTLIILLVCGILTLLGIVCAGASGTTGNKDKPATYLLAGFSLICHTLVVALVWAAL
jgi:hypothetical protein